MAARLFDQNNELRPLIAYCSTTGVMTAWEAFVADQRKLAGKEANPKLVCIDLQPYQTVQACERADIISAGGLWGQTLFTVFEAIHRSAPGLPFLT